MSAASEVEVQVHSRIERQFTPVALENLFVEVFVVHLGRKEIRKLEKSGVSIPARTAAPAQGRGHQFEVDTSS